MATITLTGDADADRLLSENPLALLIGMLLDQQVPMERAFSGPARLAGRLEGPLDPANVVSTDPELLEELFRATPALHRYPGSMAKRTHALCEHLVSEYDGDAAAVWSTAETGRDLFRRLAALPGFGKQKAQIFIALLAKQLGVAPAGWEEQAGPYAEPGFRSVADITDADSLAKVREFKQAAKQARKKQRDNAS